MTEFILVTLVLVIAVLCGLIGFLLYQDKKERKTYLNAILAKDTKEMVDLTLSDQTKIEAKPQKSDDIVPLSNLSDEDWEKAVEKELQNN